MRFDSISSIVEITPYFGKLNVVYGLMQKLWKKTNNMWNNIKRVLHKEISRNKIDWETIDDYIWELLISNPVICSLFEIGFGEVFNDQEYRNIIKLLERIPDPDMHSFEIDFSLYNSKNSELNFKTIDKHIKETKLQHLEQYTEIWKIIDKKENENILVNSFVFITELSQLSEVKCIKSIVFNWNVTSYADQATLAWKNFCQNNKWKYIEVMFIWCFMDKFTFDRLLNSVNWDLKRIIIQKEYMSKLIEFLKDYTVTSSKELWVHIIPKDHGIFGELFIENASNYSINKFYIREKSGKNPSYLKVENFKIQSNYDIYLNIPDIFEFSLAGNFGCEFSVSKTNTFDQKNDLLIDLKIEEDFFKIDRDKFDHFELNIDWDPLNKNKYQDNYDYLEDNKEVNENNFIGYHLKCSKYFKDSKNFQDIEVEENLFDDYGVASLLSELKWINSLRSLNLIASNAKMMIKIINGWKDIDNLHKITCKINDSTLLLNEYLQFKELSREIREWNKDILVYDKHHKKLNI